MEYANVLRTVCRRGVLVAEQAQEAVALVARLLIDVDRDPPDAGMLLALALRYDLTSYDAAYFELALRLRLPIATQDTELAMAARIAGVGLVGAE